MQGQKAACKSHLRRVILLMYMDNRSPGFASIRPSRRRRGFLAAIAGAALSLASAAEAVVIEITETGAGNEYMSGEPITLPAASLSTNLFGIGAQVISNRAHVALPAAFDSSGWLAHMPGEPVSPINGGSEAQTRMRRNTNGFPAYLVGQPYVWFLQNVRHYTNYACTVKVDRPVTFYLLVDNRVNDYLPDSSYDDPVFGPPDTQWILDDGWHRVNTGLTPRITLSNAGDYVGIDEGNNGSINQTYAVYARTLTRAGAVWLRTELDGNIYCLVIATNQTVMPKTASRASTAKTVGVEPGTN